MAFNKGEYRNELAELFKIEMDELKNQPAMNLEITPFDLWIVLSQMQLALRHPGNAGPSSGHARRIALRIQEMVVKGEAMQIVAQIGWDRNYDI